jgi:hypothetical protein
VDHRLKGLWRGVRVLAWTTVLAGTLWTVDRGMFGPTAPRGWQEAATLQTIPVTAGRAVVPGYLPAGWQWPPAAYWRKDPTPGWWWQSGPADAPETRLWLGTGGLPAPPAMGNAGSCLGTAPGQRCPKGWHLFSRSLGNGQAATGSAGDRVVWMVTNADPTEALRVLDGLPTSREGVAR